MRTFLTWPGPVATLFLACAFVVLPTCALAHGPHPHDRKESVEEALTHPLEGPGSRPVVEGWQDCVHHFDVGKYSDLLVSLDRLRQAQTDAGIPNLTPVSAALVRMAERTLAKTPSDADIALTLAYYAQQFSPDVPDFYFARSELLWRLDKTRAGEYVSEFFSGLRKSLSYLPARHALLLGLISLVWLMVFIAMLGFSVLLLVRHLGLLAHDLGHLLPRVLSHAHLVVITLILLFVPFLLDLGLVPLFALWWVAFWAYSSRSERVVTVLMVLFVYLWPIANTLLVNSMGFTGDAAELAYECHSGVCTWSDMRELEAESEGESGGEGSALQALATSYYRDAGRDTDALEAAFKLYTRGLNGAMEDRRDAFATGLGNVFVIKGMKRCNRAGGNLDAGRDDFNNAVNYYDSVLATDGSNWRALVNKARVLTILRQDSSAVSDLMAQARAIAPRPVEAMEGRSNLSREGGCSEEFNANRELATGTLHMPLLWGERFGRHALAAGGQELPIAHVLLIGPLQSWMLALLATCVLLAVILLTVLRRWFRPASRCIKCHAISCVKCRPELSGTGLCNQCVYYKIRSSYVDPKESWLREKRIENRVRFRRKLEAFLTFILPGVGHLLRGRAVRGVIFLTLVGTALGGIFLMPHVVLLAGAPLTPLAGSSVVGTALWTVLAFVGYFLALVDIYSWR